MHQVEELYFTFLIAILMSLLFWNEKVASLPFSDRLILYTLLLISLLYLEAAVLSNIAGIPQRNVRIILNLYILLRVMNVKNPPTIFNY